MLKTCSNTAINNFGTVNGNIELRRAQTKPLIKSNLLPAKQFHFTFHLLHMNTLK